MRSPRGKGAGSRGGTTARGKGAGGRGRAKKRGQKGQKYVINNYYKYN